MTRPVQSFDKQAHPRLLASVATLDEVDLALRCGVDLIDLKDPSSGALGAWSLASIGAAVRRVAGRRPVSATVGDLPPVAPTLARAARATAAEGVDIVKLGFLPGADHRTLARSLASIGHDVRLVAVLMADRQPDLDLAATLADAGFWGVMLDTADKRAGSLSRHLDHAALGRFVAAARTHGLVSGLAGSLRLEDVATLAPLRPDFLGFRGALCRGGRTESLDPYCLTEVRRAMDGNTCHNRVAANMVSH